MSENTPNVTTVEYLIIYNEKSGIAFADHKKAILNFFKKRGLGLTVHNTTPDGSFFEIDPSRYRRILVAGGDGTLKEVVNWLLRKEVTTPLAIIPRGSGNLVAQSLNIPLNTTRALELAVDGTPTSVDAGLVNRREYFLLAAGMGFDATVMKYTSKKLKRFVGVLAYLQGIITSFFNLDMDKVFIKSDEVEGVHSAQSVFISNIDKFFTIKVTPESKMDDGYLSVSIFSAIRARDVLNIIKRLLSGTYMKDWRYTYFKTKRVYVLPFSKKTSMQVDGELVNYSYFDIEVVPHAINIVTP